jgi:predicted nucleic-acid-binding protein
MIGLDTNILVRLLVNDDQEQNNQIVKRLEKAERNGEQLFVSKLVLTETI